MTNNAPLQGWVNEPLWNQIQLAVPIVAVDVIVTRIDRNGQLRLGLIKRNTPFNKNLWCQIGGRINRGETIRAALERHIDDALVGAHFTIADDPQPIYTMQWFPSADRPSGINIGFGEDPRQHAVALSFVVPVKGQRIKFRAGGEALDFRWFSVEELPNSQLPLWPGTGQLINALFATQLNTKTYAALSARRTARDTMLWQVPALTLAAQAFLLTIALNPATASPARGFASGLAVVASVLGMQLLSRHALLERQDSQWLEAAERADADRTRVIHAGPGQLPSAGLPWIMRILSKVSSRFLWVHGLGLFGIVALSVFLLNLTPYRRWFGH